MDFWLGIAVVFATLFGPVLAVFVTRYIDGQRDRRGRRMEVFRSIMAARRAPLSPDRVRALNMVEIEFHGVKSVETAYGDLFQHFHTPLTEANFVVWHETSRKLSTKLLTEIATVLGYEMQQLDVLDGGYYPQGFADFDAEQQIVRKLLIEVLSNKRPLSVSTISIPPAPYPPPPPPPTTATTEPVVQPIVKTDGTKAKRRA
jgi:hypothetical protein